MRTAAPKGGGASGNRNGDARDISTPSAAAAQVAIQDLPGLRARLVGARRRLVEHVADDFPPGRRFPDSGWSRLLADIHIAIMAVDEVIADGAP